MQNPDTTPYDDWICISEGILLLEDNCVIWAKLQEAGIDYSAEYVKTDYVIVHKRDTERAVKILEELRREQHWARSKLWILSDGEKPAVWNPELWSW